MHIGNITCCACGGRGSVTVWKMVEHDEQAHTVMAQSEEVTCGNCNGKGYIEYPVFSVDEAKAILKHCGLSTDC